MVEGRKREVDVHIYGYFFFHADPKKKEKKKGDV